MWPQRDPIASDSGIKQIGLLVLILIGLGACRNPTSPKVDIPLPEPVVHDRIRIVEVYKPVNKPYLQYEPSYEDHFGIGQLSLKINGIDYQTDIGGYLDTPVPLLEDLLVEPSEDSGFLPLRIKLSATSERIALKHRKPYRMVFGLYSNEYHKWNSTLSMAPIPEIRLYQDPSHSVLIAESDHNGFIGFDELPGTVYPVVGFGEVKHVMHEQYTRIVNTSPLSTSHPNLSYQVDAPALVNWSMKPILAHEMHPLKNMRRKISGATVTINGNRLTPNDDGTYDLRFLMKEDEYQYVIEHPDIVTRRGSATEAVIMGGQVSTMIKPELMVDVRNYFPDQLKIEISDPYIHINPVNSYLSILVGSVGSEYSTSGDPDFYFVSKTVNRPISSDFTVDLSEDWLHNVGYPIHNVTLNAGINLSTQRIQVKKILYGNQDLEKLTFAADLKQFGLFPTITPSTIGRSITYRMRLDDTSLGRVDSLMFRIQFEHVAKTGQAHLDSISSHVRTLVSVYDWRSYVVDGSESRINEEPPFQTDVDIRIFNDNTMDISDLLVAIVPNDPYLQKSAYLIEHSKRFFYIYTSASLGLYVRRQDNPCINRKPSYCAPYYLANELIIRARVEELLDRLEFSTLNRAVNLRIDRVTN